MPYTPIRWSVLLSSFLLGACPEDEPKLNCGDSKKAVEICCLDPEGEGEETCSMSCLPRCETDEDCSELDTCQGGVCVEPPDDCAAQP